MSERSATTDPKPPTDPRTPCAKCGSTVHTTGYHDGGAPPADATPSSGGVSPTGYHDGGLVAEDFGKPEKVAQGYHDGGSAPR